MKQEKLLIRLGAVTVSVTTRGDVMSEGAAPQYG